MKIVWRIVTASQITMGIILAVHAARNFGNPSGMELFSAFLACLFFYSVIDQRDAASGEQPKEKA